MSWSYSSQQFFCHNTTHNFLKLNIKPLPDNRLVLLQIYGSYGRNGLKPTRPLTTNDYFRKIASSAFTLYCLFKVNKVWGTDNDKHFYFLTKSIYRSFQIFLWFACRSKFLFSLLEFLHTTWKKSHKTEGNYHLPRCGSHLEVNCDNRM